MCLLVNIFFYFPYSLFVIKNFRGTCSSLKMLKGYIDGESWEPLLSDNTSINMNLFSLFYNLGKY